MLHVDMSEEHSHKYSQNELRNIAVSKSEKYYRADYSEELISL